MTAPCHGEPPPCIVPGRRIDGISAVLLPMTAGGAPDLDAWAALVERTWSAGLTPAINMDTGDLLWETPHGETPDAVRNSPVLKGLTIPRTGQSAAVGALVTRTLVIAGDGQMTSPPGRPRGAMLRAYDKKTGQEVGAVYMSGPQSGTPMTYRVDGRQYIVVATSGGNQSGEYVAYALPESARTR